MHKSIYPTHLNLNGHQIVACGSDRLTVDKRWNSDTTHQKAQQFIQNLQKYSSYTGYVISTVENKHSPQPIYLV